MKRPSVESVRILVIGLWAMITTDLMPLIPTEQSPFCWWLSKRVVSRVVQVSKANIIRAYERIKATLKWRYLNRIDYALDTDSYLFIDAQKRGTNGVLEVMGRTDRSGRAYVILKPYTGIMEGNLKSLVIYTIERALRLAKYTQTIVLIVDCHSENGELGTSVRNARELTKLLMLHYPETLAKAVVVGATLRQRLTYQLFATCLPLDVRKKISFRAWTGYYMNWRSQPYRLDQGLIHEDIGGNYMYSFDWTEYMEERPWEVEENSILGSDSFTHSEIFREQPLELQVDELKEDNNKNANNNVSSKRVPDEIEPRRLVCSCI